MWRVIRTAIAAVTIGLGFTACGSAGTSSSSASRSSSGAMGADRAGAGSRVVTVSPASGGPQTTFRLAFTAPVSAAPVGGARTGYTVSVTGDGPGTGSCLGTHSLQVRASHGLAIVVALNPAELGGRWCPGGHAVRVIETETPVCNPGALCAQYVRVVGTVGVARFTVVTP